VDRDSKGDALKITYDWKVKDRIIEHTSVDSQNESHALIGVNRANGLVYHVGGDRNGASFTGNWEADTNGDSLLKLNIESENGGKHSLTVRYHFNNQDQLTLTVELPEPIVVPMVRAKTP
jgi:hypothetical protein